jgi:ribonuclease E
MHAGEAAPSIVETETVVRPEATAEPHEPAEAEPQPPQADLAPAAVAEEPEPEHDKAVRRRSTVREKVSVMLNSEPEAATPVAEATPTEAAPPPAPAAEPVPEAAGETPAQPRRAGWWSRRFGGGQ